MKTIIIDDEPLARELLEHFVQKQNQLTWIGSYENGFEGAKAIQSLQPDLVFLDIQMPKLTGLEMLELIPSPPKVIFTTAYDAFAIQAFEKNAVDYLLKPFSYERFLQAVAKATQYVKSQSVPIEELAIAVQPQGKAFMERVAVKSGSKIQVIPIEDIIYLESQDDYVLIHSKSGQYLKEQTLTYFEQNLPRQHFVRIHRQYIVRIQEIQALEHYEKDSYRAILKNKLPLSVSKSGYPTLKSALGL